MNRYDAVGPDALSAEQREIYDSVLNGPRGFVPIPLAIWLRRPLLAQSAQELGTYCRFHTVLPPRLTELAILTTAAHWNAAYEWDTHVDRAREAGVSETVISDLKNGVRPVFSQADEEAVYELTLALYRDRNVTDDLYVRSRAALGEDGLTDLIGLLGYYALISMTITAYRVPGVEHSGA